MVRSLAVAAVLASSVVPAAARASDPSKQACVEANTKGQDLRRGGHLIAARDQLRICGAPSCPALVRDDCSRRATNGLTLFVHAFNPGTSSINIDAQVTITAALPGVVTAHVGSLVFDNIQLSIPPMAGSPFTANQMAVPAVAGPYNLFTSWSYMTSQATQFTATENGTTLYATDQWNQPTIATHDPYIAVPADAGIDWQCTYVNNGATTLTFGESVTANIMCIYMAQYFPADPTTPDILT